MYQTGTTGLFSNIEASKATKEAFLALDGTPINSNLKKVRTLSNFGQLKFVKLTIGKYQFSN